MPPRPLLPRDDHYARLELSVDASSEAVEVAWRALLKRHHPDVAGPSPEAEDRAKRINVAHDWLSDPDLRVRYDRERHPSGIAGRSGIGASRAGARPSSARRPPSSPPPARPLRRRPADAEEALARHLDRIERLTPDELGRSPADELRRVATSAAADGIGRGGPPWPRGLRPDEDDALRVSSELARRDALGALAAPVPPAARRSLERAIHALVLRHGFSANAFDALVGPWRGPLGLDSEAPAGVREDRRPRR